MKKVKVGRFKHLKDSNETKDTEDDSLLTTQQVINSHTLNTPLIEPTETKVDIQQTLSGGTMNYNKRLSTKEKLMQQAGIVHASMHSEEHQPLYKYHYDGTERSEPGEWSCCGFCKHAPEHHQALFWFGAHGVGIFYGYIRTQMVLVALYLGKYFKAKESVHRVMEAL